MDTLRKSMLILLSTGLCLALVFGAPITALQVAAQDVPYTEESYTEEPSPEPGEESGSKEGEGYDDEEYEPGIDTKNDEDHAPEGIDSQDEEEGGEGIVSDEDNTLPPAWNSYAIDTYDLTDAVFLNGETGDDITGDGTEAKPFASFGPAKAAAGEAGIIVITGTVTVPVGTSESWHNVYILRGHTGLLVNVEGSLVLDAIYMDGQNVLTSDATADAMVLVRGSSHGAGGEPANGSLVIQNDSTLCNNYNQGGINPDGGAVRVDLGRLTVTDAYIYNNAAPYGYGGGICVSSAASPAAHAVVTLDGYSGATGSTVDEGYTFRVQLYGNSAISGGGVYIGDHTGLLLQYTEAAFNTAADEGGGICIDPSDNITSVDYNYIHSNTANGSGGGLFLRAGDAAKGINGAIGQMRGNLILDNQSGLYGGGMYLYVGANTTFSSTVQNTTYRNNSISYNRAYEGGGVYFNLNKTILSIQNLYAYNAATSNGGGIYLDSDAYEGEYNESVQYDSSHDTVHGNTAEYNGGGIYLHSGFYSGRTNANISGNRALQGNGGGIHIETGRLALSYSSVGGTSLEDSTGGNYAAGNGGGICIEYGTLNLNTITFYHNQSDASGGALYAVASIDSRQNSSGGEVFYGCLFYYNRAKADGGAMCYTLTGQASFSNYMYNEYYYNEAGGNGGGMWMDYSVSTKNVRAMMNKFYYNTATEGGGLYLTGTETLNLSNDSFEYNRAHRGGGIYVAGGSFNLEEFYGMAGGSISYNTAGPLEGEVFNENERYDGGGIYITGGDTLLTISTGTVKKNHAEGNGGGIYSTFATVIVHGVTYLLEVTENTAGENGGGIYFDEGQLSLDKAKVTKNTADGNGGGLYLGIGTDEARGHDDGFSEEMTNVQLSDNVAGGDGGGAYVIIKQNGISNDISSNTITGNTATNGGGAYIVYNGRGNKVMGNTVSGNRATGDGGGFYIARTNLRYYFGLTTDTFSSNHADGSGGGVYLQNCFLRVVETGLGNANFTGNSANAGGGAIYADRYSRIWIESGSFTANNAGQAHGGAIYLEYDNSAFLESEAELEAALAAGIPGENDPYKKTSDFLGQQATVDNASFTGNTAIQGHGGAIYLAGHQHKHLYMDGSSFSGNAASKTALWEVDPYATSGISHHYTNNININGHTATGGTTNCFNNHDVNCLPGLHFRKVDADSLTLAGTGTDGKQWRQATVLEGAEFTLYASSACAHPGHSHHTQPVEDVDLDGGCWEVYGVYYSSANGLVEISGLEDSHAYVLVETQAPEGYALADARWKLLADLDAMELLIEGSSGHRMEPVSTSTDSDAAYWLPNNRQTSLPATGGNGSYILWCLGGALCTASAGLWFTLHIRSSRQ